MRKLLLVLIVGVFAAGAVSARAGMSGSKKAKAVARAIQAHYHNAKTLRALFLETYRAGQGDIRVESGTVYFRHPGLMRWDYESPQKKLFVVDSHHAWFYIPSDHAASRTSVRKSPDWRTPFALLTGRAKLSDLCGRVSIVPNPGGPGAPPPGHIVLDCQPKKKAGFLDAHIEVDRLSRIVRVLVRQAGEIHIEVDFADWKENIPIPKSFFRFQPPPGVSVVKPGEVAGAAH